MYIVIAIIIFGLLIAVHELGHFLAAKASGVRVLEFSIGMGPALFKKQGRETLYSLRILPIGGYCSMEGEDEQSEDPRAFSNQAAWKKLVILVAGAFMNFILGLLLILLVFSQTKSFMTTTIVGFMEGCPYEGENALMTGDTFYRINGQRIYFSSDVSTYLARGGKDTADIVVIRDGQKLKLEDFPMTLREYEQDGEKVMKYGVYFGVREEGVGARLKYSWYCACDLVRVTWLGLEDLITGALGVKDLSGVVGIVDVISDAGKNAETASVAFDNITYISAFIAINLAVMNMLPLPALDGGRVLFLLVNAVGWGVFKKKIDARYEGYVHTAGLVLLMGLMVFVMYNDITRIITS